MGLSGVQKHHNPTQSRETARCKNARGTVTNPLSYRAMGATGAAEVLEFCTTPVAVLIVSSVSAKRPLALWHAVRPAIQFARGVKGRRADVPFRVGGDHCRQKHRSVAHGNVDGDWNDVERAGLPAAP
jgi:hypothetical protein